MNEYVSLVVTIVVAVLSLLGGVFGKTLVDGWFERDKRLAVAAAEEKRLAALAAEEEKTNQRLAVGTAQMQQFTDNEEARKWLREQLDERDEEVKGLRLRELTLVERVGSLAEQVARQEERSAAQAVQITTLQAAVEKLGDDYAGMKTERDLYRDGKHDAENRATAEKLRAELGIRDLATKDQEIERLRGQITAMTEKDARS